MGFQVCHLTSVHTRYDIRIFKKQCSYLYKAGFEVNLIVADGKGDEIKDGIKIFDIGISEKGRLKRFTITSKKVFKKAKELNCDLYHFHDPELIRFGYKLLKLGKKVIYDVHEDVPKHTYSKDYIPGFIQPFLAFIIRFYENHYAKKFSYISAATAFIYRRFLKLNPNSASINNFPILNELESSSNWSVKKPEIAYIGGIAKIRGINELIGCLNETTATLNLAGEFDNADLEKLIKNHQNWEKVNYYGFVNRNEVKNILEKSKIGVVTFHPLPNHIDAQPNKMFEYMSAGIPIIISDFPLWKEIIEENKCGITVDPMNPQAIADAINYLFQNDEIARKMGENGRLAVINKYNWENEAVKLIEIYNKLLQ